MRPHYLGRIATQVGALVQQHHMYLCTLRRSTQRRAQACEPTADHSDSLGALPTGQSGHGVRVAVELAQHKSSRDGDPGTESSCPAAWIGRPRKK